MAGWNVRTKGGVPVELICPGCQTIDENTEAEINDATLIYGRDEQGRATGRPRAPESP
jgi:hypothetical protein